LESGNKAAAKKILHDLIAKYPDSESAQQAQTLLPATK
jgi:TolA-binding protein